MFNAYPNNNVTGFVSPNRPQARFTQPVTAEMSKAVLANDDELSVKIGPNEKIKNMCTHKYPGTSTVALVDCPTRDPKNPEDNDLVTCRVCGETFHMLMDTQIADIQKAADHMCDILQSAKTLYLDIPEEFVKEYFQIITLLKRVPQVFKKSANNWNSYEVSNDPRQVYQNMNSFGQVNNLIGGYNIGGINPMGYAQQPYQYQYQQPMYQQPPVQPQQYGYQYGQPAAPTAPQENPLMYGAPVQPAPAPGVTPPVAPPVAPAPAPQPAQAPGAIPVPPAQTGEIVQTKAFSV